MAINPIKKFKRNKQTRLGATPIEFLPATSNDL